MSHPVGELEKIDKVLNFKVLKCLSQKSGLNFYFYSEINYLSDFRNSSFFWSEFLKCSNIMHVKYRVFIKYCVFFMNSESLTAMLLRKGLQ